MDGRDMNNQVVRFPRERRGLDAHQTHHQLMSLPHKTQRRKT
jgi:hypothetical protein